MTELEKDLAAIHAAELLNYYSFDLSGYAAEALVDHWLRDYPAHWVRTSVIEALYQGRYKAVSVEQILILWRRRGHPIYHFNHEFERMVCSQFSDDRSVVTPALPEPSTNPSDLQPPMDEMADGLDLSHPSLGHTAIIANYPEEPGHLDIPSPLTDSVAVSESQEFVASPTIEQRQIELPIQPFKPQTNPSLRSIEHLSGCNVDATKHPIHQFIPSPSSSEFYTKLKAVVHHHRIPAQTEETFVLAGENPPGKRSPE